MNLLQYLIKNPKKEKTNHRYLLELSIMGLLLALSMIVSTFSLKLFRVSNTGSFDIGFMIFIIAFI